MSWFFRLGEVLLEYLCFIIPKFNQEFTAFFIESIAILNMVPIKLNLIQSDDFE